MFEPLPRKPNNSLIYTSLNADLKTQALCIYSQ